MPQNRQRRNRSGLSGAELTIALLALDSYVKKLRDDYVLNKREDLEEDAAEATELGQLEPVLALLHSKADGLNQSNSFSGMTAEHCDFTDLAKMNITLSGVIDLKPNPESHPVKTDTPREDGLWSADMLYRHLLFLEGLVPRANEAAARLWINAFLYRVAAMTPNMVLSVDQGVPSITLSDESFHTLPGYVAILTSAEKAKEFLLNPFLRDLKSDDSALFVSEAKGPDQLLRNHVPQALFEMCACARTAGKSTIRGVLTNGRSWIFLILTLNKEGGTYLRSSEIVAYTIQNYKEELSKEAIALISSIIAHWMMHSHQDLDQDNDYFTQRRRSP